MKRIFYYIMMSAIALTVVSCDNFLSVDVKGRTTVANFFSDVNGLTAARYGCYNKMYDYIDNEFGKYPDVAGNMVQMLYTSTGSDMLSQYNFTSDPTEETGAVGYIWRKAFVAMANANNLIQYEPAIEKDYPASASVCQEALGEAYTIRAMCHFDLCRTYAQPYNYTTDASHLGIPVLLKTPGADDNVSRSTVKKVYEQILADLDAAERILSKFTSDDIYTININTVYALRARVSLYMEDWDNALKYAKKITDNMALAKGNDYLNMYLVEGSVGEAIFRLSGANQSGHLKTFYMTSAVPADTLYTLFDNPNDIRLKLLYLNGTKMCRKYETTTYSEVKRDDPIVFRASEMYLIAAEASWNKHLYTQARDYIKPILSRAVDETYASNELAEYNDADLMKLIERERVKELCFEGHNFFDMTRWKHDLVRQQSTNSTMKRLNYPNDYFVLPIPQTELNANKNMQGNPNVNK